MTLSEYLFGWLLILNCKGINHARYRYEEQAKLNCRDKAVSAIKSVNDRHGEMPGTHSLCVPGREGFV